MATTNAATANKNKGDHKGEPLIWYTRELGAVASGRSWEPATEEETQAIMMKLNGKTAPGIIVDFSSATMHVTKDATTTVKDFLMLASKEFVAQVKEEETIILSNTPNYKTSQDPTRIAINDNALAAIHFFRRHSVPAFTLFAIDISLILHINLTASTILDQTTRTIQSFTTQTDPLAQYLRKCNNMPITSQMLGKAAADEFRYRGHPYDPV